MSRDRNRILAIIDPTRSEQWALRRAVTIAENRDDTDVCAFLCVYSDTDYADQAEYQKVELSRHTTWLREIITDLAGHGVTIEPVIVWNHDWVQSICIAAANADINLVVKRASGRPKSLGSSDRRLIRKLHLEMLLVKKEPLGVLERILMAVNFNATDASHVALNEEVLQLGERIKGSSQGVELHVVTAYEDSENYVHPSDIAKKLQIARSQAHVREGSAAEVIPAVARKIDADLVIVGNVGRAGMSGVTIGNTAEKILAGIDADVAVLVQPAEEQRPAT